MNSITKLIGESFKLHSQALVGFEDSQGQHDGNMQQNGMSTPVGVRPLEMQTAY